MALFVTYDEEGGFFDHLVPPTPPQTRAQGLSTVPITDEIFPGDGTHPAGPYGLGIRVPMIVVSPWTRGGWVDSQLFDHTSLIRFLETRFGAGEPDLVESNITPWRRAVVGDLTSAFDFRTPNTRPPSLPNTDAFMPTDLVKHPDQPPIPPVDQKLPGQEHGVRPARALPYTLHATGRAGDQALSIALRNSGDATAVFQVRQAGTNDDPRSYTVEPGKELSDTWSYPSAAYDVAVHGPNGFFRRFAGSKPSRRSPRLDVTASYDPADDEVQLALANRGSASLELTVRDRYGSPAVTRTVRPGETLRRAWSLDRTRGWYDLTVTVQGDDAFEQRYAGHLENGGPSISDPGMGSLL
jgi:phospholipase C